jgi:multiple sugar transport system substrate-binding protein
LPAGETGLIHRFLQGYAYPSFTGGVNSTFASEPAMAMWAWLRAAWQSTNPASTTYEFMQEPLKTEEVWIAWDHTARLIGALRERPDDFVTFPAPRGPIGLGYMPVIAGLGIPKNAPDPEASRALIEYLTRPEVQLTTARDVSFFPVIEAKLPEELPPGSQEEADAINATISSDRAIPSLLPVGLGEQGLAYNAVFRDTFRRIVLDNEPIPDVLAAEAKNLQAILTAANAPCWSPDPRSDGVCQVG